MKIMGLVKGDEAYVAVRINKRAEMDIIVTAVSNTEVAAECYGDVDADLLAIRESLVAATHAIDYLLEKPKLKKMLEERIAQLKREIAGEEADAPSPTDDIGDIPF